MPDTTLGALNDTGVLMVSDGYRTKRAEHGRPGFRILRVADVADGRISPDGEDLVHVDYARAIGSKLSQPGDVLLTTKGTVGRVALYPACAEQVVYSPQLCFFRVKKTEVLHPRYLAYWFKTKSFKEQASHRANNTDMAAYINLRDVRSLQISLPSIRYQRTIAETLGTLDDKIVANDRSRNISGDLAHAVFTRAAALGTRTTIRGVAQLVSRGITPKYTESDGLVILNQKCVRDQRVSFTPARKTRESSNRLDKLLQKNDVLVNSTGAGTLGRVARWLHDICATVDSHITIVRFDPAQADPVCAGFGVLQIEKAIEGLAEGSTGQTELRRDLLSRLEIAVPDRAVQASIGAELTALDELAIGLQKESHRLAATRDEMLPLLMSGKVRVKDIEKAMEEVV